VIDWLGFGGPLQCFSMQVVMIMVHTREKKFPVWKKMSLLIRNPLSVWNCY